MQASHLIWYVMPGKWHSSDSRSMLKLMNETDEKRVLGGVGPVEVELAERGQQLEEVDGDGEERHLQPQLADEQQHTGQHCTGRQHVQHDSEPEAAGLRAHGASRRSVL